MITLKRPIQSRRLKRPSTAFKQRHGHLMQGLGISLGLAANALLPAVPAATPPSEIHAVTPHVGIALTGAVDVEQVGRDHIIYLEDGKGIRLNNLSGLDGLDGISLNSVNIQDDGHLLLEYSDERIADLGRIVGRDGVDGVGVKTMQVTDKDLIIGLTNDRVINVGRIVGRDGDPGKSIRGLPGGRGKRGLPGRRGLPGKQGDPGLPGKAPEPVVVNEASDPSVELGFDPQTRRLRITVGEKSTYTLIPSGGGGLGEVTSDATLSGSGTEQSPLAVADTAVTAGSYTNTNLTIDQQGRITAAANGGAAGVASVFGRTGVVVAVTNDYTWAQINKAASDLADLTTKSHASLTAKGTNTHAQIDTHLTSIANPHSVTAAQAVADPAGSAAAVAGDLATHEGVSDIHIAHSGVTLTAGVGLTGGGDITANRTFTVEDTAVTPGDYTRASLTIDQQGRITAASSGSAPAVDSVFGRTGAVVAATNDYTWAQVDKTTSDLADLTTKAHVSTTGKQGGTTAEYFHLTSAQHVIATQAAGAALSGYMTAIAQTFGGVKTFNDRVNSPSHSIPTRRIECEVFTAAGINACMAELGATGGEVYLPKNTYLITESIVIPQDNITLRGAGKGTILDASGGQTFHVIDVNGKNNCTIRDLQILGNAGGGAAFNLIHDNGGTQLIVNKCELINSDQYGIYLEDADESFISDNICNNNDTWSVYSISTVRLKVESNLFGSCRGLYLDVNSHYALFINNHVYGGAFAIDVRSTSCGVFNNMIHAATDGIQIFGNYCVVANNQSVGAGASYTLDITGNGNTIIGNNLTAGTIQHTVRIIGGTENQVIDNIFKGGVNTKDQLYLSAADNTTISNNKFLVPGAGERAINLVNSPGCIIQGNYSESHATCGIEIDAATTGCSIGGNQLLDTVEIIDAGSDHTFAVHTSLTLPETTTPTALADHAKLYAKTDDKAYWQDGAGAEHELAYAGAAPAAHAPGHIDGTDQIDNAFGGAVAKTITAQGSAQVDTDQKKFGTGSCLLDGNSDYLRVDDDADWAYGTDPFTIEMWVRFNTLPGSGAAVPLYEQWQDGSNLVWFYLGNSAGQYQLAFDCYSSGGRVVFLEKLPATIVVDTWYHMAVTRSGNTWRLFQDGIIVDTETAAGAFPSLAANVNLGESQGRYLDGWIDEIRISHVARYTANFTPSAIQFESDADTKLLLHCDGADTSTTFTDSSGTASPGLMASADKAKLDGIAALADVTGDNAPQAHAPSHKTAGGDPIKLDEFATPDDNANLNATTTYHGLLKKLDNDATHFMDGQGNWAVPGGAGDVTAGANLTAEHIIIGDDGAKGVKTSLTQIDAAGMLLFPDAKGIAANTADGSDNQDVLFAGGGAWGNTRGAYIQCFGNEHVTQPGGMLIHAGDVANAYIRMLTQGDIRLHILHDGTIQLGSITNYLSISPTGDSHYVGSAGMPYGELWVKDNAVETAIGVAGTFVQFTGFTDDGSYNNTTPAHAQDHIEIDIAGDYFLALSAHVSNVVAAGADLGNFSIRKNNGVVAFDNLHVHQRFAAGPSTEQVISISGILPNLAVNDTVELWITNDDTATNLLIICCNMTILQIGGAG